MFELITAIGGMLASVAILSCFVVGHRRGRRSALGRVSYPEYLPRKVPFRVIDRLSRNRSVIVLVRDDEVREFSSSWVFVSFGTMELPSDQFYLDQDPAGKLIALTHVSQDLPDAVKVEQDKPFGI